MGEFLAANRRELIVIGLSNIECGDKSAARQSLLGTLAASPLYAYLATQVEPSTAVPPSHCVAHNLSSAPFRTEMDALSTCLVASHSALEPALTAPHNGLTVLHYCLGLLAERPVINRYQQPRGCSISSATCRTIAALSSDVVSDVLGDGRNPPAVRHADLALSCHMAVSGLPQASHQLTLSAAACAGGGAIHHPRSAHRLEPACGATVL
jgi:hypothetical protein